MNHPLVDRLILELDYPVISLQNHDEFVDEAHIFPPAAPSVGFMPNLPSCAVLPLTIG